MERYQINDLEIVIISDKKEVVINFFGDFNFESELQDLFLYVCLPSISDKQTTVILNIKELKNSNYYFNEPFINFVKDLDCNKIKTTLIYDSKKDWQKQSIDKLQDSIKDLQYIQIQTEL